MKKSLIVRGAALLTLAMGLALGGCQSDGQITAASVRANPTPEMEGIAYTPEQRQNALMRTTNTNLRQIVDDFDSFFLLDKPLHLSQYPIP